ncbi:MAG: acyltransferase [Bacteroidales bacterium]|jgi:acetyltransferase-like isoleucine patch superfamily enzyme|nr:acyltransferase [Bacteroidales bacterium]
MQKLSKTYRFLRFLGFNYSEQEYGQVSFWKVIKKVLQTYRNGFLVKFVKESWILSPVLPRKLRPWILRTMGAQVGKGVFIGDRVYIDSGNANLIVLEDGVHIAGECTLLCHQRNLDNYFIGGDYAKLGYRREVVHLKKGALLGHRSMIMPGVTIGEGAIIGAFSLVTKDIPPWTIAVGRPAKVVKHIPEKPNNNS